MIDGLRGLHELSFASMEADCGQDLVASLRRWARRRIAIHGGPIYEPFAFILKDRTAHGKDEYRPLLDSYTRVQPKKQGLRVLQ